MKRFVALIVVSALLFVAGVSAVSAGGWAVVTLDSIPTGVVVDTPVTIGMMVRQHGKTPMTGAYVKVRGFHPTGDSFELYAKEDGGGHYSADLTFDKPGTWRWQVSSGLFPEWQNMPTIEVASSAEDEVLLAKANAQAAAVTATPSLQSMAPAMLMLAAGVLGLAVCGGGLIYWMRARRTL